MKKTIFLFLFLPLTYAAQESEMTESALSLPAASKGFREGFADIIEPRLDAVVNIAATLRRGSSESLPEIQVPEGPFGELFKDFFGLPLKEKPHKVTSLGSGFVIDSAGLVVTNYHVIEHVLQEKGEIKIVLNSGQELLATIVGADSRSDLAVLRVKSDKPLTALKWGDSNKMRVGDFVLAVGNPFGLGGTVTSGIVSHTKRNLLGKMGETTHVDQWIQTDASINQGSSGGPLLDSHGNVIGINTAIFTPTGGNIGIALAVPSSVARGVVEELIRNGCIKRGYVGVQLGVLVTRELAENLGMSQVQGVMIDDVVKGTPADQAGIKGGDVVLSVNNESISSPQQLRRLISEIKPGQAVHLKLWRYNSQGKSGALEVKVLVKELKTDICSSSAKEGRVASSQAVLGISLREIEGQSMRKYDLEGEVASGVMITSIQNTSPAIDKLRPGDLILRIGDRPVRTFAECQEIIKEAKERKQKTLLFRVARPEEGKFHILIKVDQGNPS
jgi:serine protease Do